MHTRKPLYIGCTLARHQRLGVHAVVNARGGEQWRNDDTREEVEMLRDARAVRDRLASRVSFYHFSAFGRIARCAKRTC